MTKRTATQSARRSAAGKTPETPPRRRVPLWLIFTVAVLIAVAGGIYFYVFMPLDAQIPADAGADTAALPQSLTDQGFPRLGSPDAPVVVEEFTSFACPHCRDFHNERFRTLLPAIAEGRVQFVVIPVSNIGLGAKDAVKGAMCAAEQGRFWEMSDVLFDWQKRYVAQTFAERRIRKGAEAMGFDMTEFNLCLDKNHPQDMIDRALQEFKQRGVKGTPTFFIDGNEVKDYAELDALVTSGAASESPAQ
jgi:protein-disulfide isomerase